MATETWSRAWSDNSRAGSRGLARTKSLDNLQRFSHNDLLLLARARLPKFPEPPQEYRLRQHILDSKHSIIYQCHLCPVISSPHLPCFLLLRLPSENDEKMIELCKLNSVELRWTCAIVLHPEAYSVAIHIAPKSKTMLFLSAARK